MGKERFIFGTISTIVLFTLLVVIDLNVSNKQHRVNPVHGKIKLLPDPLPSIKGFQRRNLQKSKNASKEYVYSNSNSNPAESHTNDSQLRETKLSLVDNLKLEETTEKEEELEDFTDL